ncbi:MAG: cyclomaltodextrinase N-terminal domain-containing protein [Lewinellaceae bacterium]|nr:cyclomaltodextrinase N-terminal domain-containing protein [Saprospiraceae bacterium]MCB9345291.1 cyclomaltodextrinase N-terminal domain-containing protein [Lewinellaceae bacterium]
MSDQTIFSKAGLLYEAQLASLFYGIMTRFLFLITILVFAQCKDFIGNRHKVAVVPRQVSVSSSLSVEPGRWRLDPNQQKIELIVNCKGVASCTVSLGPAQGVRLEEVNKSDDPDCLKLTLALQGHVIPQHVPLIFSNGEDYFSWDFRILPDRTQTHRRH